MQKDQLFGFVVHRYLSKFVHKCIVVMPALNFLTNGFVDPDLRKLFKKPISERWGKQICLN